MQRTSICRLAALGIAALLLAGCSGGKAKEEAADEGPLSKYLSALWSGEEYTQERFDKENLQAEESVAQCMAKEGFEYKPNTASQGKITVGGDEDTEGIEWGSLEFAEKYGYGIVDSPGREAQLATDMTEHKDPNEAYVNSLSESEQKAYYETLHGPPMTEEQAKDPEFIPDSKDQGCYGKAQEQLVKDSSYQAFEDPQFAELFEAMDQMRQPQEDGETAAVEKEWSTCMADSGFPDLKAKPDAMNTLFDSWNKLHSSGDSANGDWVEPPKAKVDEFQKKEIQQAVADWKCGDKVKYEERTQEIQFALEQKFVDDHKAELDALLAKYATAQSK